MQEYINQRMTGRLPISLPTATAIEMIIGLGSNEFTSQLKNKNELWINIATLVRNLLSSLDRETQNIASDFELANTILDEMEIITTALKEYKNKITPIFYIVHYDSLKQIYNNASFRVANTDKQKFYTALLDNTLRNVKQVDTLDQIKIFDLEIKPMVASNAIMLTHSPIDLTSSIHFNDLVLLESHTGKIKSKQDWYTKYSAADKSPLLPFNRNIMVFFGDAELFKPQPIKYRRLLLETVEKFKWTSVTTKERMKLTIGFHTDTESKNYILKIIR